MKFKVGQRVYCKLYKKYGKVIDIEGPARYKIIVEFPNDITESYTIDGRWYMGDPITLSIPIEEKINKLLNICL